jgi:hypothetical protein
MVEDGILVVEKHLFGPYFTQSENTLVVQLRWKN